MPTTQSLNFNESTNQELIKNVENILDSYYFTKEYTRGEFDCSDMAKQVMNILEQHNISKDGVRGQRIPTSSEVG